METPLMDLGIGTAIGAAGAIQGIALPGAVLVGVGLDAVVALVYAIKPEWFPGSEQLTFGEIVVTAVGTTIGWAVAKAVVPTVNPVNPAGKIAMAGLAVLPLPGRVPGRLRRAKYRAFV